MTQNLPDGVTTRVILVRHGEPEAAARGRCYGKLDVGLSGAGRLQIVDTTRFLACFGIAAIVASPRVRAVESAAIVAEDRNLKVEVADDFAEIDFGDFEGLTYEEVERRFPDVYQQWMNAPTTVQFPNGESFAQMKARVLRRISELKARHQNQTFAVVSHGGVNRIVLADALQIRDADIFHLEQSFAAANIIDFYGDFAVVRLLNHNY